LTEKTIAIAYAHYERLKNERVVLFRENNGELSDEELQGNAVQAAIQAAIETIEDDKLITATILEFTPEQLCATIQRAAWAYIEVYVDYVPF